MTQIGGHVIASTLDRIVEHHDAAHRAAERAHDAHRTRPEPPETPPGIIHEDRRNPAQTDRTPRS
jgi:hypothetical protein